jgi:hypothetical protein
VVAFDTGTLQDVQIVVTASGDSSYQMTLPAGTYYVVAYTTDGMLSAGYTQAVPCGLSVACTDHSLIPVVVSTGSALTGISPQDWYAPPGSFPAAP